LANLLPFIIAGIASGSVYGLAGVGLVLTYKTSGVFNFAHGSLATVAAFIFYSLYAEHHVSWELAAILAVLVAGPVLGALLEPVGRVLSRSTLTVQVVGTVGVLLIVEAAVLLIYGTQVPRIVPQYLPTQTFKLFGTPVTYATLIVFLISITSAAGLSIFLRFTRTGVAMRGVVDNPDLLDLAGTSPTRVRRVAWIIGVVFVALSGVLLAPVLASIDATGLTLLVVTAFGAAAIGAFTSVPLTYLGGIILGLATALASKYFTTGFLGGLPPSIPFIFLFGYLMVVPRRRLSFETRIPPAAVTGFRAPATIQVGGGAALLALLIFVPSFAGVHLTAWMTMLTFVILFSSLGILVRTSGQVSLCHVGFLAIGAAAFSHLQTDAHLPWVLALVLSGLIAVPIGAILAIPAIRLSGLYLALATLGFGILLNNLFYTQSYMFGASGLGLPIARPSVSWLPMQSDRAYYFLLLVLAIAVASFVVILEQGRLGRLLQALAASPTGLSSTGVSVNVLRVAVFCLSAFLAAIAGALNGGVLQVISGSSYPPLLSVTYFALIIITVGKGPWYAVIAAAGLALIPSYVSSPNTTNYLTLVFGVAAVVYSLTPAHRRGLPLSAQRILAKARIARLTRSTTPDTPIALVKQPLAGGDSGISVSSLRVQFGGLVAVNDLTLTAPLGHVTGLIGPNGAGKTSTFNACTGQVPIRHGVIEVDRHNVSALSSSARARRGLGRTFQHMELFEELSVRENVALGREGGLAGANPLRQFVATRKERVEINGAVQEALTACNLLPLADRSVSSLATGQRRLVELARCLAGKYSVLLLDEPSSGLDPQETQAFGEIIRDVVRTRGVGVLLVEHDMSLVNALCDSVYVLDFGELICSGVAADVMASPVVRKVYLGSSDLTSITQLESVSEAGGE
jgi:ABC-type branched-subunit amino acid transport system ATPase component/branched-subunit amino acid ABC-type transport system permease component